MHQMRPLNILNGPDTITRASPPVAYTCSLFSAAALHASCCCSSIHPKNERAWDLDQSLFKKYHLRPAHCGVSLVRQHSRQLFEVACKMKSDSTNHNTHKSRVSIKSKSISLKAACYWSLELNIQPAAVKGVREDRTACFLARTRRDPWKGQNLCQFQFLNSWTLSSSPCSLHVPPWQPVWSGNSLQKGRKESLWKCFVTSG